MPKTDSVKQLLNLQRPESRRMAEIAIGAQLSLERELNRVAATDAGNNYEAITWIDPHICEIYRDVARLAGVEESHLARDGDQNFLGELWERAVISQRPNSLAMLIDQIAALAPLSRCDDVDSTPSSNQSLDELVILHLSKCHHDASGHLNLAVRPSRVAAVLDIDGGPSEHSDAKSEITLIPAISEQRSQNYFLTDAFSVVVGQLRKASANSTPSGLGLR